MTASEIAKEYLRAKRNGWLAHFEEAAKEVSFILDAADLMGLCSRESNLDPKYLEVAGDRGNAFGLAQVDKRYFPEWAASDKWHDAREGIIKGAEILAQKWADIQECIGNKRGVKNSRTGATSYFIGKRVAGSEARRVLIASYNCGRWAHFAVSKGQDADAYTTGKDYSKDVLTRAAMFRALMVKESAAVPETKTNDAPAIPKPDGELSVAQPESAKEQPPTNLEAPKVKASIQTKLAAGAMAVIGYYTMLKDSVGDILTPRIQALTGKQFFYGVVGVILVALAVYLWDRSHRSADELTKKQIDTLADRSLNNVTIK